MAAPATIENEHLTLTFDGENLSFSTKVSGARFIPAAHFPWSTRSVAVRDSRDPVWGEGREILVLHENGWRTSLRLFPQQPFAQIHTTIVHTGPSPLSFKRLDQLECAIDLPVPPARIRTFGTAGLGGIEAPGSYSYLAVVDSLTRCGVVTGWLTHERGVGVLLPQPPAAAGQANVLARLEFGRFEVAADQARSTDTLLIGFFDDARLGLEAYAEAVARQYGIQLKPQPSVYCTWYHGGASNEQRLAANTDYVAEHLHSFGPDVIQIDDRWQSLLPKGFRHEDKIETTGPIKVFTDANDNYPHGMAQTAAYITSKGCIPGIWYMPFAGNYRNPYFDHEIFAKNSDGTPFHDARWSGTCLDLSHPAAQRYVAQTARRIHDWGYRYFKLDGLHTGAPSYNIYVHTQYREDCFPDSRLHDSGMTHTEAYRKGLSIIRDNAPDAFLLGCNVSQNMVSMGPAFGLIDAMRIGPDNGGAGRGDWDQVKLGAWHGSTLYFLNGRVWHNDPDPVYVRPSIPLPMAQLMCSWVAISGSMLTMSYQFAELAEERLDLLKRTMPGHGLLGRPVDLFESEQANIWLLSDTRHPVRRDVVGLFNWDETQPLTVDRELGWLGLDGDLAYVGYDFWERRFIGEFRKRLQQTVPGGSCRVLAVRPAANHPQLISTSRHLAQCMIDVLREEWDPVTRTLSGTSRVTGGDPYELRIALPSEGSWAAVALAADPATMHPGTTSPLGMSAVIESDKDQVVTWRIRFETTEALLRSLKQ